MDKQVLEKRMTLNEKAREYYRINKKSIPKEEQKKRGPKTKQIDVKPKAKIGRPLKTSYTEDDIKKLKPSKKL
jgi:hypothetical protein